MTLYSQSSPSKLATWFMRRTASAGVRRVAPLNAAVASDVGVVRTENQDRVALIRGSDQSGAPFILAALADGIGGMKQGAECAALALAAFINTVVTESQHRSEPMDWLAYAAAEANGTVWGRYMGTGGSTLVALLFAQGRPPLWLSIGDSRVYHANDGKLHQLSRDDTLEGQLGKSSISSRRSDLLQFVGIGDSLEPHIEPIPSGLAGTLLLTSDGVHFVDADFLARVIHNAPDLGLCAKRLTDLAKMLGGPDNASLAALSIDALQANAEAQMDSCFEVWDPFGDLHVLFEKRQRNYSAALPVSAATLTHSPLAVASTPSADAPNEISGRTSSNTATPNKPQPTTRRAQSSKGKSPKKAKEARRQQRQPTTEAAKEEVGEVPQLLIKFPHKTP